MNLQNHALRLATDLARLDPAEARVTARISSGRRLSGPAEDIAGSALATRIDSAQSRLQAVEINLQNGVSRLQATDGQLGQMGRLVTRLSELATLATGATLSTSDRGQYTAEFVQLQTQLRQMIGGTTAEIGGNENVDTPLGSFNGQALFGSTPADTLAIGLAPSETLTLPTLNFRSGPIAALIQQDSAGNFTTQLSSGGADFATAITQLADARASVGAQQNRLILAAEVTTVARANHEAARSAILDSDLAAETTELSRLQILSQSHTAMLAQARDATASLLPLLQRN